MPLILPPERKDGRARGEAKSSTTTTETKTATTKDETPSQSATKAGETTTDHSLEAIEHEAMGAEDAQTDFTQLPALLENGVVESAPGVELRPIVIHVGEKWRKRTKIPQQQQHQEQELNGVEQRLEKQKCFDLLRALTKSGALTITDCSLHVVIASSICFEKTLIDSLIVDNLEPISLIDSAHLLFAKTIHNKSPSELRRTTSEAL